MDHCYNADERDDVFPVDEWRANWWAVLNEPEALQERVVAHLEKAEKPCAVRLHSSGDFFSPEYVTFWTRVATTCGEVKFWTYTRSWCAVGLREPLEELRALANVELFASWDDTLPAPPPLKWRRSLVFPLEEDAVTHRKSDRLALLCPEQIGRVPDCASCGFCMRRSARDVLFLFH